MPGKLVYRILKKLTDTFENNEINFLCRVIGDFNDQYVVGILRSLDSDKTIELKTELLRKQLNLYPYCIVMPGKIDGIVT